MQAKQTIIRLLKHSTFCLLLQDSLSKFVGRTLKDCGEDLLVEISEILFNELAFFRLMQDLDNSNSISSVAKHKSKKTNEQPSKEKQSPRVRVSVWCGSLFVFCVVITRNNLTLCFHSFLLLQANTAAGGEKAVSPAYTDEDKVSHCNT